MIQLRARKSALFLVNEPRDPSQPRRAKLFTAWSCLAPTPEHESTQREPQPERPDREGPDRECLSQRGETAPASERVRLLRSQRLAAPLLAQRAARSQAEVEVVEDLGGLVGHVHEFTRPMRARTVAGAAIV